MRLKSLEMQGFKSFPDKTTLTFGDGITAIVGPNGSGKSNISDAVRWVLGEQSTKTLRGAKMEDVIFGGTAKRNPVGYAEVSLTIDNSDGVLATEYNEVTITRRYYRSGDSEFYINRKMVRLRDIHELLMDTGLGRDGYSIIGQGRIDEILSLKSEDRREIFEEAAGISKFRHRKEEAERKLGATEENLCRIRDIIVELEGRVEPLARQAEDAKEYLKIYEELKGLEIDLWIHQLSQNKMARDKLESDLAIATSQALREKDTVEELYRRVEQLSADMRALDGQVEAKREERFAIERDREETRAEISILENDKKNNLENIERIRAEIDEDLNRAGGIDRQIEERCARIASLEEEMLTLNGKIDETTAQIDNLLTNSADAQGELTQLQDTLNRANEELTAAKVSHSALTAEGTAADERVATLEAEQVEVREKLEAARTRFKEIKKGIGEAEESLASAENVLSGVALKRQKREEKVGRATENYNQKVAELSAMEHKVAVLRDLERDMEGFSGAVKFVMKASARGELSGIIGTVASLIKVRDEYTVAVETILASSLSNIVCDDEKAAKSAMALLKRQGAGRATFRPLTTIKGSTFDMSKHEKSEGFIGRASDLVSFDEKYRNIFEDLLGKIAIVSDINRASEIAKDASFRFRIVTLDGQVINAGGSYTGGSINKKAGVLSRANEIEALDKKIAAMGDEIKQLANDKAECERELNKLIYDSEVYENEKRVAEDNLLRLGAERAHSEALVSAGEDSLASFEKTLSEEKKKGELRASEIRALEEKIRANEELCNETKVRLDEKLASNEELEGEHRALIGRVAEYRESLASISAEKGELARANEELCALKDSIRGDEDQKNGIIGEYEAKNIKIDEEIAAIATRTEGFNASIAAIDGEIEKILASRLELEASRTAADRESKDKNEQLINLERERVRLEARFEKIENFEADIASKLWENYELTITVAQMSAREIEAVSTHEKRISVLKANKKKLGNVNLGAIEEYAEVSERYEFLNTQAADLEKAKAELILKIGDLTESMRDIFSEQFKKINENFSATFTEIFGGGKAELSLEDPEDILNCGIDIKVQPPGKSLRTITLLSGGERAFVAIALYFAIMKVRPTPFCVLDEIEAALDDVNVVRYANYLRKLTKTTQFIVITHRRGTMEEADVLYGVTMQDAGISKMLTISIAEVEHELKMKLK